MLVATKYEEIYPPLLKDFVYISDNRCLAEDILEMEKKILFSLDFDIQLTSCYRFLERFSKIVKLDSVTFNLSQFMLELGLLDSKMSMFKSSLQAVSAIYSARKFVRFYNNRQDEITPCLEELELQDIYSVHQVKQCDRCFNQLAKII